MNNALPWVLLPGLDGSGTLFQWLARCCPDIDLRIVRYPDEADWRIDDYVAHAAPTIADAGMCLVVAESFSGPVALRLQRCDPRIAGVVLVASFTGCPNSLLKWLPLAAIGSNLRSLATSSAFLRTFCLGSDVADDRVQVVQRVVRALPIDVLRARLGLLRDLDDRVEAPALEVPALVMDAQRDRLAFASVPREVVGTRVAIDGPHFLLQARPEICARAIRGWWQAAG
jgi:pimeloyl-ACP methyl ester carboxylesterase